MFGGRFGVSQTGMGNTDDEFKSVPAIRKKGFYTSHLPMNEVILCLAALNLISFQKLKSFNI
jgi:hypothetical protein